MTEVTCERIGVMVIWGARRHVRHQLLAELHDESLWLWMPLMSRMARTG